MRYVVDVNVVLSALIKDSLTRKILLDSNLDFYFPDISYLKILEHTNIIESKAGLSTKEIFILLGKVMAHIKIIPRNFFENFWEKAISIIANIDEEDAIFLSLALALKDNVVIWSDDKNLKKQRLIQVITTKELSMYFK